MMSWLKNSEIGLLSCGLQNRAMFTVSSAVAAAAASARSAMLARNLTNLGTHTIWRHLCNNATLHWEGVAIMLNEAND